MLKKEKINSQLLKPSENVLPRPERKSFPSMTEPMKSNVDALKVEDKRRKKSSEKRKISRVHLGRMQFLPDDYLEDEPNPNKPVSLHDFFMAASSGKQKTVSKYLDDGGDVNSVDWCDRTALHRASLYEQTAIVNMLIDRGAQVNMPDKLCNTPLHWACRGSNMEIVQILLANKAKVNKKDQLQNTPLHVATRVGFLDCVNYLLECGARINEKDCEGDTPIHDAIRLARPRVVRTLILHGANMSLKNMNGKTAADMMQSWYNSTKEAILSAEKERKRKVFDLEGLKKELESENPTKIPEVNVKRFSIDSFESWKDDLMKCGTEKPAHVQRSQSSDSMTASSDKNTHSNTASLHSLIEEQENPEPSSDIASTTSSLSMGKLVSIEDHLSTEECKGLSKMEKATPVIKES